MDKKKKKLRNFFACLCGAFVGFVNGFLGGGGGMFCVPFLEKIYRFDEKTAHSTALVVMLPLSLVSSVVYIYNNHVDMFTLGLCGIGTLIGGVIGAFVLKKINSKWLRLFFALILLAGGIRMVIV